MVIISVTISITGGLTSAELQKYLVSYISFIVTTPRTFSFSTSCNKTDHRCIYYWSILPWVWGGKLCPCNCEILQNQNVLLPLTSYLLPFHQICNYFTLSILLKRLKSKFYNPVNKQTHQYTARAVLVLWSQLFCCRGLEMLSGKIEKRWPFCAGSIFNVICSLNSDTSQK